MLGVWQQDGSNLASKWRDLESSARGTLRSSSSGVSTGDVGQPFPSKPEINLATDPMR